MTSDARPDSGFARMKGTPPALASLTISDAGARTVTAPCPFTIVLTGMVMGNDSPAETVAVPRTMTWVLAGGLLPTLVSAWVMVLKAHWLVAAPPEWPLPLDGAVSEPLFGSTK